MKDEIKEILDYFVIHSTDEELEMLSKISIYITNLQEENEILNGVIKVMKDNGNLIKNLIFNGESITQKFEHNLRCETPKKNDRVDDIDSLYYVYEGKRTSGKVYKTMEKEMAYLQNRTKELEQINEEHRKINGELRKTINEAIEYLEYQISQLDFEKDTKAKMLGAVVLVLLQGSDE